MGRSISNFSSTSLIFLLPYIILLSVDLFGANLRATAITQLIKTACDFSNVKDFCYNVLGNDPDAQWATTRFNLENTTITLAETNYTNIARKVLTITSNETNREFKQIYRKCLHQYLLLKSDFKNLIHTLEFNGDIAQAVEGAQVHLFTCMDYFTQFPNIANPFAQDNENMASFFELIRDISAVPLE
nr:uncharacterized protein LOC104106824 [Nicotiana tomentosiformis]